MAQVYLYFFYGLAFFLMGVAVLTRVRDASSVDGLRDLQWIAIFGILHSANEWLVMFSFLERDPGILRIEAQVESVVNATSYVALIIGAVRLLRWRRWWFGGGLVAVWTICLTALWRADAPAAEFDMVTRFLLGGPASFLVAAAFFRMTFDPADPATLSGSRKFGFQSAGAAFAAYGVLTLVAQPSDLFPTTYINTVWFVEVTGVGVQWFRAAMAGAIAIALLVAIRQASEDRIQGLLQREDRLLAVLDKSPMGVSIFTVDPFERLYTNRPFSDLVAFQRSGEPSATGVETFVNPDDYAFQADAIRRGRDFDNLVAQRVRPRTGERWWSAISGRTIHFAGKEAALVWVLDISELKAREEQLAESASELREILDSCSAAVCIFRRNSKDREYVFASNRMLEMFGARDLDELNAFGFFNTFADRSVGEDMRDRHLKGDFRKDAVFQRVRVDGGRLWAMGTATEIEFEGEPAIIAWITDITQRIEEQRQISRNADQMRRIFESSKSGVSIFDPVTKQRKYANRVFLDMFGAQTLEQLNNIELADTFVSSADAEQVINTLAGDEPNGRHIHRRRRLDGSIWWASVDMQKIDFEGAPSIIAWHHDLSDQKQIETELRQTVDDLRRTQQELVEAEKMASLGGLIAGVSHEINTPVGICLTAASALEHEIAQLEKGLDGGKLTKSGLESFLQRLSEAANLVSRNARRAGELISSFKQVAVDQTSDERRTFKLVEYIEEVLTSLSPELRRHNLTFALEGDPDIELNGYPGAIGQIVTNLAMNAAIHAYQPPAGGAVEITCEESPGGDALLLFRDYGIGMDEATASRVFEPFFTTRRGNGGTGLGMHILYNLVTQRLGGRVACNSEPGNGTTVEVRLPRVAP